MDSNFLSKTIDIRYYAIIASVSLSLLFAVYIAEPINPDGVLYLRTANAFLSQGWSAAMAIYNWPFYSMLIAMLSKATHLSFIHTAQLLNAGFTAWIVTTFISLVKELGGSKRCQWIAMLVILFYPLLNHDRSWIIRDFGYLACFLQALLFLLRFEITHQWRHALLWGIFISLATAFRIEGAIFLLFAPFILLFKTESTILNRVMDWLKASSILLAALIVYQISVSVGLSLKANQLGRISELLQQLHASVVMIIQTFQEKSTVLGKSILDVNSIDNAPTILWGGLVAVYVMLFIKALNPVYLILSVYGIVKNKIPVAKKIKLTLGMFIVLNLMISIVFLAEHQFVTTRYLMAPCLLFMLWIPFVVESIYNDWQKYDPKNKRWVFPVLCVVFLALAISGIFRFGHSNAYVVHAGQWLRKNTPTQATLYSNTEALAFYAEKPGIDWSSDFDHLHPFKIMDQNHWRHYDYLAMQVKHDQAFDEQKILNEIHAPPIKIFANKVGDKIMIFKISHV